MCFDRGPTQNFRVAGNRHTTSLKKHWNNNRGSEFFYRTPRNVSIMEQVSLIKGSNSGGVSFVWLFGFGFPFLWTQRKWPFYWYFYDKDLIRLYFTDRIQVGVILTHMLNICSTSSYATKQKKICHVQNFIRKLHFWIDVKATVFNAVRGVSRTNIFILWMRQFRMEIVKSVLRRIKR